jgi:hypothetical protein
MRVLPPLWQFPTSRFINLAFGQSMVANRCIGLPLDILTKSPEAPALARETYFGNLQ